ncbi:hypothetical protein C8Q74DRAFT_999 [Fomes fomentarius]|nr:hypothetical protein C8Q74DRAFT_999 [Fomes fomentarius]
MVALIPVFTMECRATGSLSESLGSDAVRVTLRQDDEFCCRDIFRYLFRPCNYDGECEMQIYFHQSLSMKTALPPRSTRPHRPQQPHPSLYSILSSLRSHLH